MNNTIKALVGGLIVAGTAELFYQLGKGIGIGALKGATSTTNRQSNC